jgi:hypothetical protein
VATGTRGASLGWWEHGPGDHSPGGDIGGQGPRDDLPVQRWGDAIVGPQWAGGRPRQITIDDVTFIIATATSRPESLGQPFTRWSIRKLIQFLGDNSVRVVTVGRERCRQILAANDVTFQRTKTWKESNDPDRDVKLDRIEQVTNTSPDRCFAFDEFGPLTIRPTGGRSWSPASHPQRVPASYHKLHGVRQFHDCDSIGDDHVGGCGPQTEISGQRPRGVEDDP